MSLHSDTLSWFRGNQSLILLLDVVCLLEKQQWFLELWKHQMKQYSEGKLRTYTTFKVHFGFENYLSVIGNFEHRRCLAKLRISALKNNFIKLSCNWHVKSSSIYPPPTYEVMYKIQIYPIRQLLLFQ
jgi:hypothetical protein